MNFAILNGDRGGISERVGSAVNRIVLVELSEALSYCLLTQVSDVSWQNGRADEAAFCGNDRLLRAEGWI